MLTVNPYKLLTLLILVLIGCWVNSGAAETTEDTADSLGAR